MSSRRSEEFRHARRMIWIGLTVWVRFVKPWRELQTPYVVEEV